MMDSHKSLPRYHYPLLGFLFVGAIALRFWQLGTKPLWLDEVIGALFTLGHGLDAVPLNEIFPLTALPQIFSLQPGQACPAIAARVATESVHPPLFFCLQHTWMSLWSPLIAGDLGSMQDSIQGSVQSSMQGYVLRSPQWIWLLRSLPALLGSLGILAIYGLGRLMASPAIGLVAAALMTVSPFAVYLSQEARHYTLPMLLMMVALIGLVLMQQRMAQGQRLAPWLIAGWIGVNTLGLYTHYFFLLDFVAQSVAMVGWMGWWAVSTGSPLGTPKELSQTELSQTDRGGITLPKRFYPYLRQFSLSVGVVILLYSPWIPTLLQHIQRPETDWLKPYNPDWSDRVAPLYQTLAGWILMGINLPVESQPWAIAVPLALVMVGIAVGLGWVIGRGLYRRWQTPTHRSSLVLLLLLLGSLLVQTFAIVYGLDKDITAIPRYNFVSYPVLVMLFAMGLMEPSPRSPVLRSPALRSPVLRSQMPGWRRPLAIALVSGLVSTVFVVYGVVFQKGYSPDLVAQHMTQTPQESLLTVVTYESLQEVALGLSFALEIAKRYPSDETQLNGPQPDETQPSAHLLFTNRAEGYGPAWHTLKTAEHGLPLPVNLWAIASPGMKTKDYPETLLLRRPHRRTRTQCQIVPDGFHRIGFPYQLFYCPANGRPNPGSAQPIHGP